MTTDLDLSPEAVERLAARLDRAAGSEVLPTVYLGDRTADWCATQAACTLRALAAERKRADAAEAQIEWMRAALERIATLAGMVARDLTGRVEAGKVAAVKQCADVARAALAKGDPR